MASEIEGVDDPNALLLFHTQERLLFTRMVTKMHRRPELVKKAMAFWLFLQEIGFGDLTKRIFGSNDRIVDAIFNHTISSLDCILPDGKEPAIGATQSLVILGIFNDPAVEVKFWQYDSEYVIKRFTHKMEAICNQIFGENEIPIVDPQSVGSRPLIRQFGEGSSRSNIAAPRGRASHGESRTLMMASSANTGNPSTLNPYAREFVSRNVNKDSRTMFLTCSNSGPLTRDEVISFFTWHWGNVVEEVVVEQSVGRPGLRDRHARVTFTEPSIIETILNGQSTGEIMMGPKHFFAQRYVPRRG